MTLHLPEGQFYVRWQYERFAAPVLNGMRVYSKETRPVDTRKFAATTTCSLEDLILRVPVLPVGVAHCSVQDPFVKAKGRKLSFERAIASLPRASRAIAWAWFWLQFRRAA